jgi:hypothetical protein
LIDHAGDLFQQAIVAQDAGWCWFQNPRAVVIGTKVWAGYVCSGYEDASKRGQVRLVEYDTQSHRSREHILLDPSYKEEADAWCDDHNAPSLTILPDGSLLAAFTQHHKGNQVFFSHLRFNDEDPVLESWTVDLPGQSRVTYSNLIYLAKERRLYNFFRGFGDSFKPSVMYSDDFGRTWIHSGTLVAVDREEKRQRPYLLAVSNGEDEIHLVFTDGHPRNQDNSLYHMVYKSGVGLTDSLGHRIASLETGIPSPGVATRVFRGNVNQVAWPVELKLIDGIPRILFQVSNRAALRKAGTAEIDFALARFEAGRWLTKYLGSGGSQLYRGEDDYSGLATMLTGNRSVISTNRDSRSGNLRENWTLIDPASGRSVLGSSGDPSEQQISIHRPIAVEVNGSELILALRGSMKNFKSFQYQLVATEASAAIEPSFWKSLSSLRYQGRWWVRSLLFNLRKSRFVRRL